MAFFDLETSEDVGIIFFDQEGSRVNTLETAALREFDEVLDTIERDAGVKSAVLVSRKKDSFVVGADIKEFLTFETPAQVTALVHEGHALLGRLERFPKPVVAAVHGAAVGGGLELILACHYRVASQHPKTKFALPEVNLGLLPGLGGTQRLPQRVGLQQGLEMALTGKSIYAKPALKMGLVDALIHPQGLLEAGKMAARGLAAGTLERREPKRDLRSRVTSAVLERTPLSRVVYNQAEETVQKKTRGNYPAPAKIIETIRTGQDQGMEAGLEAEARNFAELVFTPQSKALIHLFFAKNASEKNPYKGAAKDIRTIGVLGAGLMGSGIAQVSAEGGHTVMLKDRTLTIAAKGKGTIWKDLTQRVGKGRSSFERDLIDARIDPIEDYAELADADLVIEAVLEDVALKQQVVRDVEAVAKKELIFASNTSSIPIHEIASAASRPEQVVGMHYFSPVPKLPLIEIVATEQNPDWVLATAFATGRAQGKTPIIVGDAPGFYTTRILSLYMNEALLMLGEGVGVREVDKAMRDFGFPVGPITLLDEVGIDVGAKINKVLKEPFAARGITLSIQGEALVEAGFLGRKNGKGFYVYGEGKKGDKEVNEELTRLIGSSKRDASVQEIQERLGLIMVNEAVLCLEEGVLRSARDGDVGAVFGLGFPPFLGGPFWYTDTLGPQVLLGRLQGLERRYGPRFTPATLLREQAEQNRLFYPS